MLDNNAHFSTLFPKKKEDFYFNNGINIPENEMFYENNFFTLALK